MHDTRRQDLELIQDLIERGEWQHVYQRSVLFDFATEARMAFQLAFLRPFAVPRMAKVLVGTGHITADPERRAYRTGIMIHELISEGLESRRARQVISHMNRAHRAPGVTQHDLTYVLSAFVVVPTRYLEVVGWRPLLDGERHAAVNFYARLGQLMGIKSIPQSYNDAAAVFDRYEQDAIAPSAEGRVLGRDVIEVLRRRLPALVRPLAAPLFASQLDDPRILDALGIDGGPAPIRAAVNGAMQLSAALRSRRPAPVKPSFYPGQPAGRVYAQGYDLDELTKH